MWADFDLSDSDAEDHVRKKKRMEDGRTLPGVATGDAAAAYKKDQFLCYGCNFAMDGKQFSVSTNHGLYMYKIDMGLNGSSEANLYGSALERFAPTILTKNVTVPKILKALKGTFQNFFFYKKNVNFLKGVF